MHRIASRLAALALVVASGAALAQSWPSKPVRLIVPTAAGGANDVFARLIGASFEKRFGQPFVVEARPGALSQIGTEAVVKSPADGYTLLVTSIQVASEEALNPAWNMKFENDLTAISMFVGGGIVLVASNKLPVKNLAELVAYSKANPGKLNQAEAGGISTDLAILKHRAGAGRVETILYKGAQPAFQAVVTGEADFYGGSLLDAVPLEKAGRLRILAYGERTRHPMIPQVPTIAEALGMDDYEASYWFLLAGPAGLPRDIVTRLNAATNEAMKTPEVAEKVANFGMRPLELTPEQARERVIARIRLLQKLSAEGVKFR
jgi:tripartite-type tricarboxylate transporter receptor subunit TctC